MSILITGGAACSLICDIQHNHLGNNPFVPVTGRTWRNTKERIKELIGIGADGLVIKPISNNAIYSHVNVMVNDCKPFVVTSSYIGPTGERIQPIPVTYR